MSSCRYVDSINYNHGQKSWDKFTFVALFHTRQTNSSTLVQLIPLPPTPPPPTMLDTCTRYFSRVSTLYWAWGGGGGGGGEATHFKTEHSAFLKLMQLHKCPKEFCPPLQVSCDHVVLALGSHITFWSFLKQIKFAKPKTKNLIKQLFHSRLLDMRLVIANSYPTRAHGIIVKYTRAHELSLNYKTRAPRLALQN